MEKIEALETFKIQKQVYLIPNYWYSNSKALHLFFWKVHKKVSIKHINFFGDSKGTLCSDSREIIQSFTDSENLLLITLNNFTPHK